MKCPVCKSGLKITCYHNDYILEESESECTVCWRYKEQYAYGSTEVGVKLDAGWRVWGWSYDISAAERERINAEIEQAAKSACSEWATTKILKQRQQARIEQTQRDEANRLLSNEMFTGAAP